jgi:hypothetical protein
MQEKIESGSIAKQEAKAVIECQLIPAFKKYKDDEYTNLLLKEKCQKESKVKKSMW